MERWGGEKSDTEWKSTILNGLTANFLQNKLLYAVLADVYSAFASHIVCAPNVADLCVYVWIFILFYVFRYTVLCLI